jgi:outer membrane protein OmpA-like peptidoglycan-associated protein/tetratricopeptide (TPR) repeat protein
MNIKYTYSLVILFFSITAGFGQKVALKMADKEFTNYAYFEAREIYEKVAKKGYKSVELFSKLGDSYYFNAQLPEAANYYGQLFELNETVAPEYYYRYSQCLKSLGDYTKANEYMDKFSKLSGNDERAKKYASQRNYLDEIKKNSGKYKIEDAGVNTQFYDFGAAMYKNSLVFASSRDTGGVSNKKHSWTNQSFTNLYAAEINEQGILQNAEAFSKKINSLYNESSPVFTKDGSRMYFTRNNYLGGKLKADAKKTTLLKIYTAVNNNGNWEDIKELPFNSNDYSVAHPALSPDGKYLYFASDMPGGKGLSDLYKVKINGDDTFGAPENLGTKINTEGRETFPFIADDNVLYFASDAHPGLGGLDVFATSLKGEDSLSKIVNLGEPLNSKMDDFALLIDSKSKVGFFTSNREGGKGADDIYKLKEVKPVVLEVKHAIVGTVTETGAKAVAGAMMILFDKNNKQVAKVATDADGKYRFDKVNLASGYSVRMESDEFETAEKNTLTGDKDGETVVDFEVARKVKKIQVGDDLAKIFKIEIIYFDLDKSFIRPDAAIDLAKIVEVMKQNPTMKVDVRSHTDCRQTADYNAKLSDRRAKATIAWMVEQGIAKDRLTGKGYGESQLVNDCGCEPTNASTCTEEEHQKNRRSEFIILSL